MKLPFRRNRPSVGSMPAEIQNYYQTEQRERVGVAWFLAAGVFVVTLLLASGIFFGGKWAYRKISHKDPKPTSGQVAQPANDGTAVTDTSPSSTSGEATTTENMSSAARAGTLKVPTTSPAATTPASLPNTNGDE